MRNLHVLKAVQVRVRSDVNESDMMHLAQLSTRMYPRGILTMEQNPHRRSATEQWLPTM